MNDDPMNDLEQRLQRRGNATVTALDSTRVDAIERRLLTDSTQTRRPSWITAVAAACVLLAIGAALLLRRDDPNTLQPSTPSQATVAPSTTPPTTTTPSNRVPPASFALNVERMGNELRFTWPHYLGDGATQYLLIRVDADGLTSWPPTDARVAATRADLESNSATLTLRGTERRRWVVAVIGENRRLIAISDVAIST